MLYLIDANVLITAHNLYYPLNRVPEFWSWLAHMAEQGRIKMPLEIYEEIKDGSTDTNRDPLYGWITEPGRKGALVLNEEADVELVRRVLGEGYAPDLTEAEVEDIGADPFLIASALADRQGRCVVTTEGSKPTATRQNRRIPDVCTQFGVKCIDTFALVRALDFRTSWSPDAGRSSPAPSGRRGG
jgi:hypothetical protein